MNDDTPISVRQARSLAAETEERFSRRGIRDIFRGLISDDGSNEEYDRALIEAFTEILDLNMDHAHLAEQVLRQFKGQWSYHLNLAVGQNIALEFGPLPDKATAMLAASDLLGQDLDLVNEKLADFNVKYPNAMFDMGTGSAEVTDTDVIDTITIERYDGETTDGNWSIDLKLHEED